MLHLDPNIIKNYDFSAFQQLPNDFATVCNHNCENIVGGITVPLGVAGPVRINGQCAQGDYLVPLATTEACLVASVNRGAKWCRSLGEITTTLTHIGISRSPVLQVKKLESTDYYHQWLEQNRPNIQTIINTTSSHLQLKNWEIHTDPAYNYLFICFYFDSADAMGMNMATIASRAICDQLLCPKLDATLIAVSSNWCSDKKPAQHTKEHGRGFSVTAEISFECENEKMCECANNKNPNALRLTPNSLSNLLTAFHAKITTGSTLAGALGHNAHHANIIAALYLATGQDLAHVVEGSLGDTRLENISSNSNATNEILEFELTGTEKSKLRDEKCENEKMCECANNKNPNERQETRNNPVPLNKGEASTSHKKQEAGGLPSKIENRKLTTSHLAPRTSNLEKLPSLTFSVHLPAILCGTIGGGTKLPHQSATLQQILKLKQPAGEGQQAKELAEIIAATVLCGELSLLKAITDQELAGAHARMR